MVFIIDLCYIYFKIDDIVVDVFATLHFAGRDTAGIITAAVITEFINNKKNIVKQTN